MSPKRSVTEEQRSRAVEALEELRAIEEVLATEFGFATAQPALMDTVRTIAEARRRLVELGVAVPARKFANEET